MKIPSAVSMPCGFALGSGVGAIVVANTILGVWLEWLLMLTLFGVIGALLDLWLARRKT